MENKMIISKKELISMINSYILLSYQEQNAKIICSNLKLARNESDFIFEYTICINENNAWNNKVLLSEYAILNVINCYLKEREYKAKYYVIDKDNHTLELNVEKINEKQKKYGGRV